MSVTAAWLRLPLHGNAAFLKLLFFSQFAVASVCWILARCVHLQAAVPSLSYWDTLGHCLAHDQ